MILQLILPYIMAFVFLHITKVQSWQKKIALTENGVVEFVNESDSNINFIPE
jgi:hypothetical protein